MFIQYLQRYDKERFEIYNYQFQGNFYWGHITLYYLAFIFMKSFIIKTHLDEIEDDEDIDHEITIIKKIFKTLT